MEFINRGLLVQELGLGPTFASVICRYWDDTEIGDGCEIATHAVISDLHDWETKPDSNMQFLAVSRDVKLKTRRAFANWRR